MTSELSGNDLRFVISEAAEDSKEPDVDPKDNSLSLQEDTARKNSGWANRGGWAVLRDGTVRR